MYPSWCSLGSSHSCRSRLWAWTSLRCRCQRPGSRPAVPRHHCSRDSPAQTEPQLPLHSTRWLTGCMTKTHWLPCRNEACRHIATAGHRHVHVQVYNTAKGGVLKACREIHVYAEGTCVTRGNLQRPGTAKKHSKTVNTYSQPKRPSTCTANRPSTGQPTIQVAQHTPAQKPCTPPAQQPLSSITQTR